MPTGPLLIIILLFGAAAAILPLVLRRRTAAALDALLESGDFSPDEDGPGDFPEALAPELRMSFQRRYREMASQLSIPPSALRADKVIDVFSLKGAAVSHYCWKAEGAVHAFPVWESVEELLACSSCWVGSYRPEDENNLSKLTFPLDRILSYSFAPELGTEGEVILRHLNFSGRETVTIFVGQESADTFDSLIPDKRLAFVRRMEYLRSPRNISDLKREIGEFRGQLLQGLITPEEYEERKTASVLRL